MILFLRGKIKPAGQSGIRGGGVFSPVEPGEKVLACCSESGYTDVRMLASEPTGRKQAPGFITGEYRMGGELFSPDKGIFLGHTGAIAGNPKEKRRGITGKDRAHLAGPKERVPAKEKPLKPAAEIRRAPRRKTTGTAGFAADGSPASRGAALQEEIPRTNRPRHKSLRVAFIGASPNPKTIHAAKENFP